MKKEITVRGIISEINVDKKLGVVIKQNYDGTADFIIKFGNSKEEKKFENEAKRLNLAPEGYLKVLILSGISRKEMNEIVEEYGL